MAAPLADELDYIALQCAKLPRRDQRSADRIIGYDKSGSAYVMVVDTSALIAIMGDEPERHTFNKFD